MNYEFEDGKQFRVSEIIFEAKNNRTINLRRKKFLQLSFEVTIDTRKYKVVFNHFRTNDFEEQILKNLENIIQQIINLETINLENIINIFNIKDMSSCTKEIETIIANDITKKIERKGIYIYEEKLNNNYEQVQNDVKLLMKHL